MNIFVIASVLWLVFAYYGGKYVPKVLNDNKRVLLGFVSALVLCVLFKKDLVEGWWTPEGSGSDLECRHYPGSPDPCLPENSCWSSRDRCETAVFGQRGRGSPSTQHGPVIRPKKGK